MADLFNPIGTNKWEIAPREGMRVPGIIYGNEEIINELRKDVNRQWSATKQIINVAKLPGIQKASLAMSDVHPGYGFPIGGVGAFDIETGIVSMAGVGYDINCGVRTMKTDLTIADFEPKKREIMEELFRTVPAGLGRTGKITLEENQINELLVEGAKWVVERGYGTEEDLEFTEEKGSIEGADPSAVSHKAKQRQYKQIGTLGSGNHYLEVQKVETVYDGAVAKAYGLFKDQIIFTIHCGSRGLGHQIGTDYAPKLVEAAAKYNIKIPEKELGCAPITSKEGQQYISAVYAGINCAFSNRQVIAHLAREAFKKVYDTEVTQVYDIAHNTCKMEVHDGKKLLVHRKGATRAFGPGSDVLPAKYRSEGQPVIIGGTMGTYSFILSGTSLGMKETFGSACHGAGRAFSRSQAKKRWWGKDVVKDLASKNIIVKAHSMAGVAEEAPGAYKNVNVVVDSMHDAGVVKKVVKMVPLGVMKG
ncbi:MAG: RtcB family protein [Promethearchaeota archaeon]